MSAIGSPSTTGWSAVGAATTVVVVGVAATSRLVVGVGGLWPRDRARYSWCSGRLISALSLGRSVGGERIDDSQFTLLPGR